MIPLLTKIRRVVMVYQHLVIIFLIINCVSATTVAVAQSGDSPVDSSSKFCDEWFRLALDDPNLTVDERQALYDQILLIELADSRTCNQSSSSSPNSRSGISTASPNALTSGEQSIAVAGSSTASNGGSQLRGSTDDVGEEPLGKSHEDLEDADNQKLLAEQILARANAEKDPKIKASLMAKYKELTK